MRIATSLTLLAVGLVLALAVHVSIPVLDIPTLGAIIALVGLLGLALTIGMEVATARPRRAKPPAPPSPASLRSERPFDPLAPPPARPVDPAEAPTRVRRRPRQP